MPTKTPATAILAGLLVLCPYAMSAQSNSALSPSTMKRIGTVNERYQSYNIEMLEVTGGGSGSHIKTSPRFGRLDEAN